MSPVKLGFSVAWPAFWTGFPFKAVIVLLLLAMGLHPWEGGAVAALVLLSVPIDLWALSLVGRTVFAERLRVDVKAMVGVELWWRAAAFSAVYVPLAYLVESKTIDLAHRIADGLVNLVKAVVPELPIAEKILIDVSTWGGISVGMALLLGAGWLWGFGLLVRSVASKGQPVSLPYETLIRLVDEWRVPADQTLVMAVFMATGIAAVVLLWAVMPVYTPHPHEAYATAVPKERHPLNPPEALSHAEKVLTQAEAAIAALEKADAKTGKKKAKKT
jgi:hypothetical protein